MSNGAKCLGLVFLASAVSLTLAQSLPSTTPATTSAPATTKATTAPATTLSAAASSPAPDDPPIGTAKLLLSEDFESTPAGNPERIHQDGGGVGGGEDMA